MFGLEASDYGIVMVLMAVFAVGFFFFLAARRGGHS